MAAQRAQVFPSATTIAASPSAASSSGPDQAADDTSTSGSGELTTATNTAESLASTETTTTADAESVSQISPSEFRQLAGKSMSEVRDRLGSPSNVIDDDDGVHWHYWPDKLKLYDADAGTVVQGSSGLVFDPDTHICIRVSVG